MAWDLIADIGGTNARFAAVSNGKMGAPIVYNSKGPIGLLDAIESVLAAQKSKPNRVVLAIAGRLKNGEIELTNAEKSINIDEVKTLCTVDHVHLINDFEAAAWSLASIDDAHIQPIRAPSNLSKGHRLILGVGTGLGVGTLVDCNGTWHSVPGEGGHVGIYPDTEWERDVFRALVKIWPETRMKADGSALEAEAILSGTGLPKLYEAISSINGQGSQIDNKELFKRAQEKEEHAAATVAMFSRFLGRVAGDLTAALLPYGGVFFTGGVVLKNPWVLDKEFVESFNAGGRFSALRSEMPLYLYNNKNFGLDGAANALNYLKK